MFKFAHRGASGTAPENTLSAMKKAMDLGVEAVEFDVQLSKDNKLVVIHDYKVDRTTNGKGYVMRKTLQELKALDAGSWYGDEYKEERIPTLEEVIEFLPEDILLNIEIKSFVLDVRDISARVVEVIERYDIEERVIISSFDHKLLKRVKEIDSSIKIGLLFYGKLLDLDRYPSLNYLKPYSLHFSADYLDEEDLMKLSELPYKVYSYTINDLELAKKFEEYGLDGYFTDYPGKKE